MNIVELNKLIECLELDKKENSNLICFYKKQREKLKKKIVKKIEQKFNN